MTFFYLITSFLLENNDVSSDNCRYLIKSEMCKGNSNICQFFTYWHRL